jgi:hypothetical protein
MGDGITIHREVPMIYLPFFTTIYTFSPFNRMISQQSFGLKGGHHHPALHFSSSTGWGGSNISCNCYIAQNGPSSGFL